MEDLTGKQFGPYRVVAPLGEGGMAAVYRAYQASMDRYVALKVLPQYFARDPEFVGRFAQEAKVLAKLQHVHILPVHDFGEADGYTYIAMPFVQTGTLADLLDSEPLPLDQVEKIISQVGSALNYAHSQGVVHRDVKPSNILIDSLGNCLLTDFGIAKIVEGTTAFTQTGGIIGTPAYMSPEQIRGEKLDGRSDVYSLGVVLYEMATGRPPYKAETPPAIFVKHLHDPLPPPHIHNSEIPQGVERVILKALCKERDDRFDTPGEMAVALTRGIVGDLLTVPAKKDEPELPAAPKRLPGTEMGVPATRVRKEKRERKPFRLPKWVWGAAGGLLLVVVVIALILVFGGGDGTNPTATDAPPAVVREETPTQRTGTEEPAAGAEDGAETFTVRFELSSSSDWLDVNLIWAQGDIVEGSTVETGGEPDEAGLDGRTINLDQEIERAEEGNELYLVEHVTLSGPVDGKLGVTVSRGCIGRSRVNVYHLATGSPVLLQQTADERDCADPQYFSIPIATLLSESPPESPTPLPTESPGVALYEEGIRLLDREDWSGALARFDEAIAAGWESGGLYHDRGIACRGLEEEECALEQELESYIAAIDLGEDTSGVYRDRGWAYANLGEPELAIDDFSRAIELEPNDPHNWTARGDQYFSLGDIDAGLADWNTAIDLEPQNADLHSSLGWACMDLGDPNLAFESFSRAIELDPVSYTHLTLPTTPYV